MTRGRPDQEPLPLQVGHIFGASHDDETLRGSGKAPFFPYGRGFLMGRTGKRTMMA